MPSARSCLCFRQVRCSNVFNPSPRRASNNQRSSYVKRAHCRPTTTGRSDDVFNTHQTPVTGDNTRLKLMVVEVLGRMQASRTKVSIVIENCSHLAHTTYMVNCCLAEKVNIATALTGSGLHPIADDPHQ